MAIYSLDDDPEALDQIRRAFAASAHEVQLFANSASFFRKMNEQLPSLVLLDWVMPDVDGPRVLAQIRERYDRRLPVIFVTSMESEDCISDGLNAGADDYLVKPVYPRVLLARTEALLRRESNRAAPAKRLTVGEFVVDSEMRTVSIQENLIKLTPREFDLFWLFVANRQRFLPKGEIALSVWGREDIDTSHSIGQHVYNLRKKLALRDHGLAIVAVYGVGYRLELSSLEELERSV